MVNHGIVVTPVQLNCSVRSNMTVEVRTQALNLCSPVVTWNGQIPDMFTDKTRNTDGSTQLVRQARRFYETAKRACMSGGHASAGNRTATSTAKDFVNNKNAPPYRKGPPQPLPLV